MPSSLLENYSYYDILLWCIPVILTIIVILFRLFIQNDDPIEFIGLNPLKIMDLISNEINLTDMTSNLKNNQDQLDELSIDDVLKRDKNDELSVGNIDLSKYPSYQHLSHGERESKRSVEFMFKKPFTKAHPDFLINPKTKRRLELDCYNEELGLAIEYQGDQHYNWPNKYHTYEQFRRQLWRDDLKARLCEENKVHLITVSYKIPMAKIHKYIYDQLPHNLKVIANKNMN